MIADAGAVEFVLNGRPVRAQSAWPQMTLLDWLRHSGLTGAKEGCAEGECGACAVATVVRERGRDLAVRTAFRVVNSCLLFLPMVHGREIVTVEGLAAGGDLVDAQQAMAAAGGSQCGYCTPGFVMSLFAEQFRPDRTGPCDPLATAGNLCRCTGYRPIRDAALALGPPRGPHARRLAEPVTPPGPVAIDGFTRPATLGECAALLAAQPDATIVAGATDLAVESNLRAHRWRHVVDIDAIDALKVFDDGPQAVTIGAALPLADLAREWLDAPPVFLEWLALFASPPIRNRATIGGSLATASPIGDAAPLLAALDARVHVASAATGGLRGGDAAESGAADVTAARGRRPHADGLASRSLDIAVFFTGYRQTAMQRGELLTAIEIPKPLPQFVRFYKVAKRPLDDISTVAAAMALDLDGRIVRRVRFAFGGVAATPLRITAAEDALAGRLWDADAVSRAQQIVERTIAPLSDHRGSAAYRGEVAKSLVEKFWRESRA